MRPSSPVGSAPSGKYLCVTSGDPTGHMEWRSGRPWAWGRAGCDREERGPCRGGQARIQTGKERTSQGPVPHLVVAASHARGPYICQVATLGGSPRSGRSPRGSPHFHRPFIDSCCPSGRGPHATRRSRLPSKAPRTPTAPHRRFVVRSVLCRVVAVLAVWW
jgi:hypothetical protein